MEQLGISLVVDYIVRFSPELSREDVRQKLAQTLAKSHALLQTQRRPQLSGSVTHFEGFDWFLSTIFVLLAGDPSATIDFVRTFLNFMPSMYIWSQRSLRSTLLSNDRDSIPLCYSTCSHLVEAIVETELPEVFSAFTLSGCTPSQVRKITKLVRSSYATYFPDLYMRPLRKKKICQRWIREVFWNVLPFREIANYVLLTLAFGTDYVVYFCIALLRHASPRMMLATREQELIFFLNEARFGLGEGFATRDHFSFMQSLEVKYRTMVMVEMRTAVGLA